MPELPEVENLISSLRPRLVGSVFEAVHVLCPTSIREPAPAQFTEQIAGRTVLSVRRRGKYIVCLLDDDWHLVIHLRMTGQLLLTDSMTPEPKWARVVLPLRDGRTLWFCDMRKFGRLALTRTPGRFLKALGPEPFDPNLDVGKFHARLQSHKRPIKSLLLHQSFLAGLGNIYADESLFEAGINPCTPASALTLDEAAFLLESIRSVLYQAIANRGTTIATYVDANGTPGRNQEQLRVYGRAGEPCPRCQTIITRVHLGSRSTYFCPRCQPQAPSLAKAH